MVLAPRRPGGGQPAWGSGTQEQNGGHSRAHVRAELPDFLRTQGAPVGGLMGEGLGVRGHCRPLGRKASRQPAPTNTSRACSLSPVHPGELSWPQSVVPAHLSTQPLHPPHTLPPLLGPDTPPGGGRPSSWRSGPILWPQCTGMPHKVPWATPDPSPRLAQSLAWTRRWQKSR